MEALPDQLLLQLPIDTLIRPQVDVVLGHLPHELLLAIWANSHLLPNVLQTPQVLLLAGYPFVVQVLEQSDSQSLRVHLIMGHLIEDRTELVDSSITQEVLPDVIFYFTEEVDDLLGGIDDLFLSLGLGLVQLYVHWLIGSESQLVDELAQIVRT